MSTATEILHQPRALHLLLEDAERDFDAIPVADEHFNHD
jgi:hypothetical protein